MVIVQLTGLFHLWYCTHHTSTRPPNWRAAYVPLGYRYYSGTLCVVTVVPSTPWEGVRGCVLVCFIECDVTHVIHCSQPVIRGWV